MSDIKKERLGWIDATKGLAMLLVIWGHVQDTSPLYLFVISFHVPLFLVVSGVLFGLNGSVGGGISLLRKLIKPYITFSLIAIIAYLGRDMLAGDNYMYNLGINIYKTLTGFGIHALWFIPSYFIACTIYKYVESTSDLTIFAWMIIFILAGVVGSYTIDYAKGYINQYDFFYYPFASIIRGIVCTYYVCLGRFILKMIRFMSKLEYQVVIQIFLISFSLFFSYYYSQKLSDANFSLVRLGNTPLVNFVSGSFGAFGFILLFNLVKNVKMPALEYIGKNSLTIMGTHMSLLLTVISMSIMTRVWNVTPQPTITYYIWGIGCVLIVMMGEVPIIWLFNHKFKFLIDKI